MIGGWTYVPKSYLNMPDLIKKGLYAATAIVLVSVLLGVFPFVLAYQVIAPLVMGEAITASFIIQHVILGLGMSSATSSFLWLGPESLS